MAWVTLGRVDPSPRENNFNLMRMVAAWAVLVSHSFFLTTGRVEAEPLYEQTGMTLGTIAVHCFFVLSGFLVSNSLLQRRELISYAFARVLRVMPALAVMLVVTVFFVGPLLTQWSLSEYLTSVETWRYFTQNLFLYGGVAWHLPGVFENNPHPLTVNGSLWTITHEVRFYTVLALIWAVAGFANFRDRVHWLKICVLLGMIVCAGQVLLWHFGLIAESQSARLGFMFLSGVAYKLYGEHIRLGWSLFCFLVVLLALASLHATTFLLVYLLALPYLLLCLAYLPRGLILGYNKLGDYSYGLYVYAFFVQQSVITIFPGIEVPALVGLASLVSIALASLSWHLIEHPALQRKTKPHS
ncbi:MAG: acyltransferase family protein [Burkholderiaceae bacterium]